MSKEPERGLCPPGPCTDGPSFAILSDVSKSYVLHVGGNGSRYGAGVRTGGTSTVSPTSRRTRQVCKTGLRSFLSLLRPSYR